MTTMIAMKFINSETSTNLPVFLIPYISFKIDLPKQTTQSQEETVGSVCPGQAQS